MKTLNFLNALMVKKNYNHEEVKEHED